MSYSPDSRINERFKRSASDVVSANERALIKLVWRNPGISRSELTEHTDLRQPSVYRIVDQLVERGVIALGNPKTGQGRGQPSPTLSLNGEYAYSCGISLNTDVIGICLVDFAGRTIDETSISLRDISRTQALEAVRQRIDDLCASHSLAYENLFGIGFAIAGYHLDGTRYNAPLPLREWSLIELGPLLGDFFHKPVWVNNGSNTAAVAESMFGAGRQFRHFAYLSFNYGFGGGLISDGELLIGGNGNAGSFSGMFDEDERSRRPALQFLLNRLVEHGVEVPSISYMHDHFDRTWPGVQEWLEEATPPYNRLINAITAIFDPQAIVFGGQISPLLADLFINRTQVFTRPRYGVSRPLPKLIVSEIRNDASALGAAITPFRSTFY